MNENELIINFQSPFFTVVIPTYNRADILPTTIASVLGQKFQNLELLVVDDGSSDNTKQVVEGIPDKRVHYIYQKNAERSVARNNGVAHSKGRYICFLDSDDFYHKDFLQEMYKYISSNNYPRELIVGGVIVYQDENNEELKTMPDMTDSAAEWLFNNPITPTRVCVEKSIFNDYKFREDVIIVEDTVLWVSLMNKYKVALNPSAIAYYRWHEGNSISFENNAYGKRLNGLKNFFKSKESNLLSPDFKAKALSDCYFGIFKHHKWHNRTWDARKTMLEAIWKYPTIRLKEKVYLLLKG